MRPIRRFRRRLLSVTGSLLIVAGLLPVAAVAPVAANTSPQSLPFSQNWTDTGLITVTDDWSATPGVVGFLGQDITTATGTDPQTLLGESAAVNDVDVIANQLNPNILGTGGVAEFQITDPVVALQGSGTADAPYLLFSLDSSGVSNVTVDYNLRDIDGTADNAVQQVALQFRIGSSGNFTNLPAGYVADGTTGPSLATLVTHVSVVLPAEANHQPLVQVRVITTNAAGNDEWVGVDEISITAAAGDVAPVVTALSPVNGATGVAIGSNVTVTFSEPVNVSGSWFSISCSSSGLHPAVESGGPNAFALDPTTNFLFSETCTVTILAANVTDQDADDPPDIMATNFTASFTTEAAPTLAAIVISEVYGGGGNAGATYTNDFIELYNPTASAVSLVGWSVQYASATGTGAWVVTPLNGAIASGRNYLVQEAAGAGGTTPLPSPDAIGSIAMSATAGKVALVSNTTPLSGACPTSASMVDLVGYGAANCFETAPTAALSNTTSAQRKAGGAQDTGNNSDDFTVGAPDPHAGADQAPSVSSSVPASGAAGVALDANVSITFSEPINTTGSWYAIGCASSGAHSAAASGGPTTFTLDPASNFATNESCTVTIFAANVTDQDAIDPPENMAANHTFTFQTADVFTCGDPATLIHQIQGTGLASGMLGAAATIEGIVVGDYQLTPSQFGGFYLQEETTDYDADPLTSEGIFVFDNGFGVDVLPGDVVRVRGTVTEFFNLTELGSVNAVQKCAGGASVPPTAVSLPVPSLNDLERFEGMLVQFSQQLTATEVFNLGRFGEVSLSGAGRLYTPTAVATPGPAALAVLDQNNRSRIVLDDGNNEQNIDPTRYPAGGLSASNTLRVGDTLSGLTGVMDFRFSNYRIQPVGPISFVQTNPRTPAPAAVGGNLKIASFNVLNFFNGDGLGGGFPTARGANTQFELDRQRAKEVSALSAMNADIVGLMEIENDAGANTALADLVAALNAAMGAGTYAYVDTGVIGTDEIKVALIYKPAAVTPVGAWAIITSVVDPRFIDTLNRPSLAQTFQQNATGGRLTVIVNHLKSKGSACVGDPDTGDGSGNCNGTRTQAAAALVDWLATDPTGSGDTDFLLIGDMNSYTFETPIAEFEAGGFTNLVRTLHGLTPYSYVFNGESGYLDHALASASLAAQVTGVTDWHINPDEPTVLDYNTEFKTLNQVTTFYDPGPYRSSDHDPVVIGLHFNGAPTVGAGGPYSVGEGSSVVLTATGSDPDGDSLTYAWDLDNNGSFETLGQSVTFSAAAIDGPASRTVHVRVTDGGASAIADATVNITNVAPTATFNAPGSTFAGSPFSISLTEPADPSAADRAAGFQYAFDCGDGAGYGAFGAASSRSCPTTDTGSRTVRGTIRDKDGGFTAYTRTVSVVVTYNSLCDLGKTKVTPAAAAKVLCATLQAAAAAEARGNIRAKDALLKLYRLEVDVLRRLGRVSTANAELLKRLSTRL